tara:strand:+ start:210 stop:680 length:471 start_codon:yes stop_codon:yes gene_type:complete
MEKIVQIKREKEKRSKIQDYTDLDSNQELKIINMYFLNEESIYSDYITSEVKKKISSYKQQDKKKNKFDENTIIKLDETIEKMVECKLKCFYCKENVKIFYKNVRDEKQWTLERLDNNIGHTCNNTVISCLQCNLQRRNKNSKDFKFAKQLVIKKI